MGSVGDETGREGNMTSGLSRLPIAGGLCDSQLEPHLFSLSFLRLF